MASSTPIAVVTGSAQGLGRAIAERLARAGCAVAVCDIDGVLADRAAGELTAAGYTAIAMALDVRDVPAVEAAFALVDRRFGRLDILVNNAGISAERSPIEAYSLAGWNNAVLTNLTSMFLTCRKAVPIMRRKHFGRIVNLASLVARGQPGTNRVGYVATKFGIVGFSRALAEEVGRDGITVNCVAPSRIRTPLSIGVSGDTAEFWAAGAAGTVLNRLGTPGEIADAVSWLCSDGAGFVTGAVLDVNGGTRMR